MKQSITYYLILFILKIKGLKKDFSQDPIDFKKIRKEDVLYPKGAFFKQNTIREFKISDSFITEIGVNATSEKLLIYIHGGAFISGPAQHHWDALKTIAKATNSKIWMCLYPKAPEHKISEISKNIDLIYAAAAELFNSKNITLIGDSAGGTLVTCLTQRLIQRQIPLPGKIILISPVMDASMTNAAIESVDAIDRMLSKKGVLSAKKMCVEKNDLKNELISPLYGSFQNFPQTVVFLAEHDITYPDQKLAVQHMIEAKVDLQVVVGKNMPHIWPLLPVMKEAKVALNTLIQELKK